MRFKGADSGLLVSGEHSRRVRVNGFIGGTDRTPLTDIPTYSRVACAAVWAGIDAISEAQVWVV
jgi:hypothetical protein